MSQKAASQQRRVLHLEWLERTLEPFNQHLASFRCDRIYPLVGTPRLDDFAPRNPSLVLHPFELQNAAGKYGANSIYLLLNESEDLKSAKGLHDCTILSKDGDRYRGESLNEVSCKDEQGVALKFSQYAGRASFYSCGESATPKKKKG